MVYHGINDITVEHPDYIEYFKRGSAGTKSIKQDFWVRTTARHPNMKRVA